MDRYREALPEALAQIREWSILTLAVSMDVPSFLETRRIAEREPLILPCFGIHPWEAPRYAGDLATLDPFLETALLFGEIGLDHHFVKDRRQFPAQDLVFAHLPDAAERKRAVINLHTKAAERDVLEHLRGRSFPGVILHWYSGPLKLVDEFLDLGAYFTIGVEVLRSRHIQALAQAIPGQRLLTEPDNPGGWQWMEGELGYPELLAHVESKLAEVRGADRNALAAEVRGNLVDLLSRGRVPVPDGAPAP
jgi:TatD DNase family protein